MISVTIQIAENTLYFFVYTLATETISLKRYGLIVTPRLE